MDRNSLIGLLLIGGLLIGYSVITRPSKEELQERQRQADSIRQVEYMMEKEAEAKRLEEDSLNKPAETLFTTESDTTTKLESNSGVFTQSETDATQFITLENENLRLLISPKGGHVYSAELKNYKTWDQKPLILFEGEQNIFNLKFYAQNKPVFTKDLLFEAQSSRYPDPSGIFEVVILAELKNSFSPSALRTDEKNCCLKPIHSTLVVKSFEPSSLRDCK